MPDQSLGISARRFHLFGRRGAPQPVFSQRPLIRRGRNDIMQPALRRGRLAVHPCPRTNRPRGKENANNIGIVSNEDS